MTHDERVALRSDISRLKDLVQRHRDTREEAERLLAEATEVTRRALMQVSLGKAAK